MLVRQLYCLALLAFVCRALIPAGFMPDVAELREGRPGLMLCPAGGALPAPVPAALLAAAAAAEAAHAAHAHHPDAGHQEQHGHHEADGGLECPFSLLAAPVLLPSLTPLAALAPAPARGISLPVPASLPALAAAGPPLGSRAPPFRLA